MGGYRLEKYSLEVAPLCLLETKLVLTFVNMFPYDECYVAT